MEQTDVIRLNVQPLSENSSEMEGVDAWYYPNSTENGYSKDAGEYLMYVDARTNRLPAGVTVSGAFEGYQGLTYKIVAAEIAPTFSIPTLKFDTNTADVAGQVSYVADLFGEDTLTAGEDYTVALYKDGAPYAADTLVLGTYTAVIKPVATSNYTFNEQTVTFQVTESGTGSADLSTATVELAGDVDPDTQGYQYTYTGSAVEPMIAKITDADGVEIPAAGYEVAYKNTDDDLTNVGEKTLVITGKDGYRGTKEVPYTVVPAKLTLTANDVVKTYDGKAAVAPEASAETVSVSGLAEGDAIDWETVSLEIAGTITNVADSAENAVTVDTNNLAVNSDDVDEEQTEAAGETVYVSATDNYDVQAAIAGDVTVNPYQISASDFANLTWDGQNGVHFDYGTEATAAGIINQLDWNSQLPAEIKGNNFAATFEVTDETLNQAVGVHEFTIGVKEAAKNFTGTVTGSYGVVAGELTVQFTDAYKDGVANMTYGDANWKKDAWDPTATDVEKVLETGVEGLTVESATFTGYGNGTADDWTARATDVKIVDAEGNDVTANYKVTVKPVDFTINKGTDAQMPAPEFKIGPFNAGDTLADMLTEECLAEFAELGISADDLVWYAEESTAEGVAGKWQDTNVFAKAGTYTNVSVGVKNNPNFNAEYNRSNTTEDEVVVNAAPAQKVTLSIPATATKAYDGQAAFEVADQTAITSGAIKDGDTLSVVVAAGGVNAKEYDVDLTKATIKVTRPSEENPDDVDIVTDEYEFTLDAGMSRTGVYTITKADVAGMTVEGVQEIYAVDGDNGSIAQTEVLKNDKLVYSPATIEGDITFDRFKDETGMNANLAVTIEKYSDADGDWEVVKEAELTTGTYRVVYAAPEDEVNLTGTKCFEFSVRSSNYDVAQMGLTFEGESVEATYDADVHNVGTITAKDGDEAFADFELVYKKDGKEVAADQVKNAGTYEVWAKGTGKYFGEVDTGKTVEIAKAKFNKETFEVTIANVPFTGAPYTNDSDYDVAAVSEFGYEAEAEEITVSELRATGENQSTTYVCVDENEEPTTAFTVSVSFAGNENYEAGKIEGVSVVIDPVDLSTVVAKLDNSELTFNGAVQTVSIKEIKTSADENATVLNQNYLKPTVVEEQDGTKHNSNAERLAGNYTAEFEVDATKYPAAKYSFVGTLELPFTIKPIDLGATAMNDVWTEGDFAGFVYSPTGTPVCYDVTSGKVWINNTDVTKFVDATATSFGTGEAGQQVVGTIKAKAEYAASITGGIDGVEFGMIASRSIASEGVEITVDRQVPGTSAQDVAAEDIHVVIDGMVISADQYTVTPSPEGDALTIAMVDQDNYTDEEVNVELTYVEPNRDLANAKVTLDPAEFVYDGKAHMPAVKATSLLGQAIDADEYSVVLYDAEGNEIDEAVNAGTYFVVLTANQGEDTHYAGQTLPAMFEIAKAELATELVSEGTVVYDGMQHGVVLSEALPADVTVEWTLNGEAWAPSAEGETPNAVDAGAYAVTAKVAGANYEDLELTASFEISKRPATVAAEAKSKAYGEADPELTAAVSNVVEGEELSYTLTREAGELPGAYAINVELGDNPNYDATAVAGVLTIGDAASAGYTDTEGHWAESFIDMAAASSLMNGVGEGLFDPNGTLTRGMVATILFRATPGQDASLTMDAGKIAEQTNKTGLPGVEDGAYYTAAINWAFEAGIMTGVGQDDGTADMQATGTITREQLGTMVERWAASQGAVTADASDEALRGCDDVESVSEWAYKSLAWTSAEGILGGKADGERLVMDPQGTATRAEMAKIIVVAVDAIRA